MPKKKLTDPFIRKHPPTEKQFEVYDTITTGMAIRFAPSGRRVFVYRYWFNKTSKRYTIGKYPEWSLAAAREKARDLQRMVDDGIDPLEEKKKKKHTPPPTTVKDLAEKFIKQHLPNLKKSTRDDYRRRINSEIITTLGQRPVNSVSKLEIIELLEEIAFERGAEIQSNRVRAILSSMYTFGENRGIVFENPFLKRIPALGKESRRDRVYTEDEIKLIWKAFEEQAEPIQSLLKILLICGQRSGETRKMKWSDIKDYVWIIPAENTKASRTHHLPLPDLAIETLENLHILTGKNEYVFPSPSLEGKHIDWLQKIPGRIRNISGVTDFKIHDLRRTAATYIASLGFDRTIVGKVLNHKGISGDSQVTAVYDRFDYFNEKQKALERWSSHLRQIVTNQIKTATIHKIG